MRSLDLFAGIGGFALGFQRAGIETAAFCEREPYAQAVLRKHWRDVPIYDDVRTLNAARLEQDGVGPIDIICGGFPCQDISLAGKGAGLEGARSGLWFEFHRLIGELRPRYVVAENVSALRSRGLETVLRGLSALGYDAEWHCIPAAAVGAPHRRDRVWIVAHTNSAGLERRLGGGVRERPDEGLAWTGGASPGGTPDVPDDGSQQHESRGAADGRQGTQIVSQCEQSDAWFVEPDVGRSFDGFPEWLDRYVGAGLSYAESARATQALRHLWGDHVSQALRRAAGGLERFHQAQILFAFLREYENGAHEARLLVEGEEASENFLRSLRQRAIVRSAPRRSGRGKQPVGEHPDALQSLSRLLARDGEAHWAGCGWEDATPRVAHGVPRRVDRLRCLGNAVVPQIPEMIGKALLKHRALFN